MHQEPKMRPAAFAIPGDYEQLTGGFIYERSLLLALREAGRVVEHLQLPAGFPYPTQDETATAHAMLTAIPADVPVILDGLVFGSIDPAVLDAMRAPVVAMLHHPLGMETGITPENARFLLAREAENLTRAAHVVVPSPHTAAILQAEFGVAAERITIALPGFARPKPTDPVVPSTPPLILSVGLLAARKGHDTLIDALAQITDLDWQANIVGGPHDPDVATALATQIVKLGLQGRVRLLGVLQRQELDQYYRKASIFALATRYEGYGMVFGEAMLHGLPIVSCQTGAVPDTVPKEAGLLVPVDAPDTFAGALRHILTDAKTRRTMAAASAASGAKLPTWTGTAAIMGRVLDGCYA
jgi:glycosyltransferase involved in cell wall biosynthesis